MSKFITKLEFLFTFLYSFCNIFIPLSKMVGVMSGRYHRNYMIIWNVKELPKTLELFKLVLKFQISFYGWIGMKKFRKVKNW